jgi:hypothetical protein
MQFQEIKTENLSCYTEGTLKHYDDTKNHENTLIHCLIFRSITVFARISLCIIQYIFSLRYHNRIKVYSFHSLVVW